jgi:hypothetical protein
MAASRKQVGINADREKLRGKFNYLAAASASCIHLSNSA